MNNWQYHDNKMKELKQIYSKISKQTQNRVQEIFDSIDFDFNNLYSIANNKTKQRANTYIEEWKDKGLLTGYFGMLANNIYRKTRVKNSEILELLIYGAYIDEQNRLQEQELNIFKEDANYYYQQGQQEVNKTLKKKKEISVIPDAIFLALLDNPNAKGYQWSTYIEAIIKYNVDQIYRQAIIDLQQQKELDITNDIYQNIIKRQQNSKLNINDNKISGDIDLTLIGINNQAKLEGIYSFDDKAKVKFVGINDEKQTKMCKSLDGQEFYIHDWNEFERYSKSNDSIRKYRCYGLIIGLNLPPIDDGFHWCRSYIIYLPPVEKEDKKEYNIVDYIRKNNFTSNKILDKEIKRAIKLLPKSIQELLKNTKYFIANSNSYYDRNKDEIHLLKDSNKYEVLHEIGHVIETKLDLLHNKEYINIQQNGLNIKQIHIDNIKGYGKENEFWLDGNKFISDYQRRVYEQDIDGNYKLNYSNFTFNAKTLGEYFSEGFRSYFENNKLLKKKDIELYNYIKEILK